MWAIYGMRQPALISGTYPDPHSKLHSSSSPPPAASMMISTSDWLDGWVAGTGGR